MLSPKLVFAGGVFALLATSARADILAYNSTRSNPDGIVFINDFGSGYESNSRIETTPGGIESDAQTGDIATLAGSGRTVTMLEARFFRFANHITRAMSVTATCTLYSIAGNLPDQVLWSGQAVGSFSVAVNADHQVLDLFFSPNVDVPGTFAFAIAIDNFTDDRDPMGPRYTNSAPVVGSSPDYIVYQDSATSKWYQGDSFSRNLEAKVWTIPGNGSMYLAGLACVRLCRRRRP